jgi:NB-ARC domain
MVVPQSKCPINSQTHALQALLKLLHPEAPGGVCVLSLHGMGGIGKTMLARELYSRLSSCGRRFSREVFLEVGPDADLAAKQRRLLKLLAGPGAQVPKAGSPAEQTAQLRAEIREGGTLLLALDSLWSPEQRDALLPLDALPQGSRVLLTSRSADNLLGDDAGPRGTARREAVEFLPPEAARRLLCMHGFGEDAVPEGFAEVVRRALAVCSGLPLALEAVGSGLRCKMPADSEVRGGHSRSHGIVSAQHATSRYMYAGCVERTAPFTSRTCVSCRAI